MISRLVPVLAFSAVFGVALAQTTAPGAPQTSPATPPSVTPSAGAVSAGRGMSMADTATVAVTFATVQPASVMASRLLGVNVYNKQNESIGEIQDFAIIDGKTISAVIVSVGGFLGIGESYVAIEPSSVALNQRDGRWRAYVDTSKENLNKAPKFEYARAGR